MDDLNAQINQILNDPQSMQMLQNIAQSLGISGGNPPNQAPPAPPQSEISQPNIDIGSLISQLNGSGSQPLSTSASALDMNALMQVQRAMSLFNQGSQSVDLLRALRPLLSINRQKKVDDAIRILQLLQMLPLLKDSGIFGGIL